MVNASVKIISNEPETVIGTRPALGQSARNRALDAADLQSARQGGTQLQLRQAGFRDEVNRARSFGAIETRMSAARDGSSPNRRARVRRGVDCNPRPRPAGPREATELRPRTAPTRPAGHRS